MPQLEQAAVEYAAGKLHQVKKARGLPTLSAVFLRGNIFSQNWTDQLGGPFDCVHVGGSCSRERINDLMRLVKEGGCCECVCVCDCLCLCLCLLPAILAGVRW